jgi:hypothetical protein
MTNFELNASRGPVPNGPSQVPGHPSGGGRGNHPPAGKGR